MYIKEHFISQEINALKKAIYFLSINDVLLFMFIIFINNNST